MSSSSFEVARKNLAVVILSLLLSGFVSSLQAQTVVRVSTTLGDFSIELFDSVTPGTVQNFLNYVNSGRYIDSFVHRMVPDFVIQGGGFTLPSGSLNIEAIDTDGPIANEPGQSNVRGTVAMAKVAGNPDSATSQWFVNLSDNTFLDSDNGGFTVFGRVIDDGMTVVDSIGALGRVSIVAPIDSQNVQFSELPVINFDGSNLTRNNFIFTNMEVITSAQAPNRFDNSSGELILRVDAGSSGIVELAFAIESQDPEVVIRGRAETVVSLPTAEEGYSTFDDITGQLVIPELEVDGTVAYRNLVLSLTDADQLLFTLQSFE
ncbi:MAG: peptidylprolyl isomerase [Pseudomonadales bacterium]|nr:peptidylprolyl isomerase [Pseudomonadales bacterium]